MATVSPTPMSSSQFAAIRRPASRNAYKQPPSRPLSTRLDIENVRNYSLNDSSDDEIPMPMKLSALTKALLNDEASIIETSTTARTSPEPPSTSQIGAESVGTLESSRKENQLLLSNRGSSPTYPRRVVRLSGTPGSSGLRRGASLSNAVQKHNEQQAAPKAEESALDLATPAPVPRTVRVSIGRTSMGSSGRLSDRYSGRPESPPQEDEYDNDGLQEHPSTITKSHLAASQGSVSRYNPSTVNRSRYGEEISLQSSMRVKRGAVPKVFGTFMRGPARRGRPRASQSDEEHSPMEGNAHSNDVESSQEPRSQESRYEQPESRNKSPTPEIELSRRAPVSSHRDYAASGSPPSSNNVLNSVLRSRSPQPPTLASSRRSDPRSIDSGSKQQPAFRLPAPRPGLPATHDQENETPPTFRRNKQPLMQTNSAEKESHPEGFNINSVRANGSPERRPLAVRDQNTPRRPAPPPPKMSVLEAATSAAGAATASHANRKSRLKVNGKVFTRLDVIGRGGSSKVYRVMAENSKIFALKRVLLEDADESAIRGFKGEIDLLKKLGSVERVIHLYDYELNDERGILSVVGYIPQFTSGELSNIYLAYGNGRAGYEHHPKSTHEIRTC